MFHSRLHRMIDLLGRIPRSPVDAREAVERLIAPGLAADVRDLEARTRRDIATIRTYVRTLRACETERDDLRARLDVETAALRRSDDGYRAMVAKRDETEAKRAEWEALTHGYVEHLHEAERQRDYLRVAMAGALRELDAADVPDNLDRYNQWFVDIANRIVAARGLLRATLGEAPQVVAPVVFAEQAHAIRGAEDMVSGPCARVACPNAAPPGEAFCGACRGRQR